MKTIKAKYIVELANGPISEEAYGYLVKQDVVILPDVIANAGGVIVSYLEWQQNINKKKLTEEQVNMKLHDYIVKAVDDTHNYATKNDETLKDAALAIALQRLI